MLDAILKGLVKIAAGILVAFCFYYLIMKPENAADAVLGFFGLFGQVGKFFSRLAGNS